MQDLKRNAYFAGVLLLAMWLVWLVDATIPFDLRSWGLVPRSLWGLPGIVTMPLIHDGIGHLLRNTVPLIVLLLIVSGTRRKPWPTIGMTVVFGGGLLWIFGRYANHIGASGLVFGLIGLLIASGFLHKRIASIAVAIAVGILFGGTLIWGVLPIGEGVSWDGHLTGFLGGIAAALAEQRLETRLPGFKRQ
ncbi:rhomboid family intramembrane serine protease [Roseiconus lacunae]|uniref:rhomboid family intramembrane serine protease n=1 Tax=Roseiconus lacunae TaxID=2605694 RepID=UPI0011F20028|nr:rhomboid family intramembrane serine protease [Roseiconus lacunae]MCD0461253.1 rhomboid family intramembrane serine protease [Roseiconus lacunae]WRQ51587.1 rhomboid family intramembrane serine protease [Stieleria sp. HD01]